MIRFQGPSELLVWPIGVGYHMWSHITGLKGAEGGGEGVHTRHEL